MAGAWRLAYLSFHYRLFRQRRHQLCEGGLQYERSRLVEDEAADAGDGGALEAGGWSC